MEHFPVIHTNFWDAVIAVPSVLILTQLIKILFPIPKPLVPSLANVIGLIISIFIAHPHNWWAGVFMGFFYGNAAVGAYASLKTSFIAYKRKKKKQTLP
ncbi:hypothetical protein [Halobacillus sp. BBL2006]|uniref:hypothetical protein n=1 Tax=Halobacillus sp. BBL2006 TaxID=1543706 RepID=UPI0005433BB4|nr:hypothetical protein [Halobacillus sp. BBL2006]KHE67698.1 hypothetical protein LD39_16400 [Halobacillus sp. BBL2006]